MNDRIKVGFRNDKTLLKERIVSKREFPVEVIPQEDAHVSVVVNFGRNETLFDSYISALADYIIDRYETRLLSRIIKKNYDDIKPFQIREMLGFLLQIEADPDYGQSERKKVVCDGLREYFSDNLFGSVEGIVTFRLRQYQTLLTEVAERVVALYLGRREYEEFIALLRYFVTVQNGRPHMAHLVVQPNGIYSLLDEQYQDITAVCVADFVRPGESVYDNFDDLLISILITLAPQKLLVHNRENIQNEELFETIEQVFETVEYCSSCNLCKKGL